MRPNLPLVPLMLALAPACSTQTRPSMHGEGSASSNDPEMESGSSDPSTESTAGDGSSLANSEATDGTGGRATTGTTDTGGATEATGGETAGEGGSVNESGEATEATGEPPVEGEIEVLLSEFTAYWDFEASSDQSVLPAFGVGELELSGATVTAGTRGNEMVVSGAGDHAATAAPVLDTSQDFSVSAWVKLDRPDGYDTFVGMDGGTVSAFFLQKRDDERLSFTTFSSDTTSMAGCVATGELRPRAGEWYFVVGTYSAATGERRIYVDGVLSGKTTCSAGVFQAAGGLSVGRGFYGGAASDPWSGALDDLGVIARVLTPEEIASLYRYGRPDQRNYLFAYFIEVSQGRGDGLRLAHSHDGRHFGAIGAGKVFMPPSVGGGSFRDPHLSLTPDGLYHLVWTTSCVPWAEANCVQDRGLGHATSPDLVTWSAADYITVDLNVEHVWAPETFYDEATDQTMIFWSSPVDATANADPHAIYYVLTADFRSFSEPAILYARPGRNFIDATIHPHGDAYLMVVKDEADGQKNLRALVSEALFGASAWTVDPSLPLTGNYAAEGPSFLEREGNLFIYFDKYGEGAYGALEATTTQSLDSPASWTDISDSVFFPGVRHGTPIEVPWDVFHAVAAKAGE